MPLTRPPANRPHEPVRTFHARGQAMGRDRRDALDRLWPRFGLAVHEDTWPHDATGRLDVASLFGRVAPLVLEIGPGMGEATVAAALADPGRDVLAVEVHLPGVAALLLRLEQTGATNVRVGYGDGLHLARTALAPGSVDEVRAYFPDPWPKARHRSRRLVAPPHVAALVGLLRPGGLLHVATDWPDYAEQMRLTLAAADGLEPLDTSRAGRPVSAFERKALAAGRAVVDLRYRRVG